MPFLRSCGSPPVWPLTGLYGKTLEGLKGGVCVRAGTPWLHRCTPMNTLIHLPLRGRQAQIFAPRTYLIFMMTKANIACWVEWHGEVKLWAWLRRGRAGVNVFGVRVRMCACPLLRELVHITGPAHTALFALKHACKYDTVQQTVCALLIHGLRFQLVFWDGQPCWWKDAEVCTWGLSVSAFGHMFVPQVCCVYVQIYSATVCFACLY